MRCIITDRFRWVPTIAVLALSILPACGITHTNTTESTLTVKGDSREIIAVIDGPASITSTGNAPDTATVVFGTRKLVVEKERVLLDGKEQAKLSADAKKVQVEIKDGRLTVTADGAAVDVARNAK
jgi:hypothetical protein